MAFCGTPYVFKNYDSNLAGPDDYLTNKDDDLLIVYADSAGEAVEKACEIINKNIHRGSHGFRYSRGAEKIWTPSDLMVCTCYIPHVLTLRERMRLERERKKKRKARGR